MGFDGFPKDATKFLSDLKRNNNREWFNVNKDRYKTSVEGPAKEFLEDMSDRLTDLAKDGADLTRRPGLDPIDHPAVGLVGGVGDLIDGNASARTGPVFDLAGVKVELQRHIA